MKARRVSKVHFEYFDEGTRRYLAACGVTGGTRTGDVEEVSCVTCTNSKIFRSAKEAQAKEEAPRNRFSLPRFSFSALRSIFSNPRVIGQTPPKGDGLDILKSTKQQPGLRARPVTCPSCGKSGGTMVNDGQGHIHLNCKRKIVPEKV